jgi:hypothetical protein
MRPSVAFGLTVSRLIAPVTLVRAVMLSGIDKVYIIA